MCTDIRVLGIKSFVKYFFSVIYILGFYYFVIFF